MGERGPGRYVQRVSAKVKLRQRPGAGREDLQSPRRLARRVTPAFPGECRKPGYGAADPIGVTLNDVRDDIDGLIAAPAEGRSVVPRRRSLRTVVFHPERVRAVVGLSVPHLGRGSMPSVELFRKIFKDRFFYQLYFQEPGVAEAELEANVRRSLRKIYHSTLDRKSDGARIPRPPGRPGTASILADRGRSRLFCRSISGQRLQGPAQSLSQLRTRFRTACGRRRQADGAADGLSGGQPRYRPAHDTGCRYGRVDAQAGR